MRNLLSVLIVTTAFSASASYGDDAPRPGSPEAIAAVNAALAKDIHSIRSPNYLNASKGGRALAILSPDDRIKLRQMKENNFQNGVGTTTGTTLSDGTILGSSIGGIPTAPEEAQVASDTPVAAPVPTAPPANAGIAKPPAQPARPVLPAPPPMPESKELVPLGNDKAPVAAELSDGTQAVFNPDGRVSIVTPNGRYHRPPDGVLTLRDGTTFSIENGVRVDK